MKSGRGDPSCRPGFFRENQQAGMNIKEKAALTSLALNVLLTGCKFLLFLMSGSLAVLAETWHSFADIGTSFMVYLALNREREEQPADDETQFEEEPEEDADREPGEVASSSFDRRGPTFEQSVALGIGITLLVVAILVVYKAFSELGTPVRNPLTTGLIFIVFAFGSHLVYRFESRVGVRENSVGLISDGMHARTDMAASLATGVSLILYHMGVNVDRWMAGIIGVFVLTLAIETIVNVGVAIHRRSSRDVFGLRIHTIIWKLFSAQTLAALGRIADETLHIRFFRNKRVRNAPIYLFRACILFAALSWMSTAVFTLGPSERGFVERFGRTMNPERPLGPGVHLKAPWPMDRVRKADAESIRRMNIGNTTEPTTFALLWTRRHGSETPFLSGDNNYFYPYLIIHYKIANFYDFAYRHTDSEQLMRELAHQLAGKLFATRSFYEIVLDYREQLVRDLTIGLQAELDEEKAGVEIVGVAVKDVHPPIGIADSFENVIASYQEKARLINAALGYRNQKISEARGEAVRMRKEAEARAEETPIKAQGDADRFLSRIPPSEKVETITKRRLWLSSMREALEGRAKVVVDPDVGRPEVWFNTSGMFGDREEYFEDPDLDARENDRTNPDY